MSFSDVLHSTPGLLIACMQNWCRKYGGKDDPGAIRCLRLVSKSVGEAALAAVRGYSLSLGGDVCDDLDGVVKLLGRNDIRSMTVVLVHPLSDQVPGPGRSAAQGGAFPIVPTAWSQLPKFISGMKNALKTVTSLTIRTRLHDDTPEINSTQAREMIAAASRLLVPLAVACPQLRKLDLDGDIGQQALSAFGSSSTTFDEVSLRDHSISYGAFNSLHSIVPNLKELSVYSYTVDIVSKLRAEAYCAEVAHALSPCTHLDGLLMLDLHLKQVSTWTCFPPSLTYLAIGACSCGPPKGMMLPKLACFRAHGSGGLGELGTMINILHAAPCLKEFSAPLASTFKDTDVQHIMTLHDKCKAGLLIEHLQLLGGSNDSSLGKFLSQFPILPCLTTIYAPVTNSKSCMIELLRVFPNLLDLSMGGAIQINSDTVSLLSGSLSLRKLDVSQCQDWTDAGVVCLLTMPALKDLRIGNTARIANWEVLKLQIPDGLKVW